MSSFCAKTAFSAVFTMLFPDNLMLFPDNLSYTFQLSCRIRDHRCRFMRVWRPFWFCHSIYLSLVLKDFALLRRLDDHPSNRPFIPYHRKNSADVCTYLQPHLPLNLSKPVQFANYKSKENQKVYFWPNQFIVKKFLFCPENCRVFGVAKVIGFPSDVPSMAGTEDSCSPRSLSMFCRVWK